MPQRITLSILSNHIRSAQAAEKLRAHASNTHFKSLFTPRVQVREKTALTQTSKTQRIMGFHSHFTSSFTLVEMASRHNQTRLASWEGRRNRINSLSDNVLPRTLFLISRPFLFSDTNKPRLAAWSHAYIGLSSEQNNESQVRIDLRDFLSTSVLHLVQPPYPRKENPHFWRTLKGRGTTWCYTKNCPGSPSVLDTTSEVCSGRASKWTLRLSSLGYFLCLHPKAPVSI